MKKSQLIISDVLMLNVGVIYLFPTLYCWYLCPLLLINCRIFLDYLLIGDYFHLVAVVLNYRRNWHLWRGWTSKEYSFHVRLVRIGSLHHRVNWHVVGDMFLPKLCGIVPEGHSEGHPGWLAGNLFFLYLFLGLLLFTPPAFMDNRLHIAEYDEGQNNRRNNCQNCACCTFNTPPDQSVICGGFGDWLIAVSVNCGRGDVVLR